jgi:glycosyltransferase involved in cell wall biosynthesis
MKVALVHDWLIHMRGGEKVLEALAELYPDAVIYTLFSDRAKLSPSLRRMTIRDSFLHYLPGIKRYYRWLLPLLPFAIRTLRIESDVRMVISSSHCVAKGVRIPDGAAHVCYCHTPMRYLWGFEEEYFSRMPPALKPLLRALLERLRRWDKASNETVGHFISNSENVRKRIRQYYEADAAVIYPPFDRSLFSPPEQEPEDNYYLVVSAFVPYKKVDLVIETFNDLDRNLLIVGSGPMSASYRRMRKSSRISFLGAVPNAELVRLYSNARAVIFPTNEDFGIVPLEAQACGTPVIAYGKGGALESVKHGVFFDEQTAASLKKAIEEFESRVFVRDLIPSAVKDFEKSLFKERIRAFIGSRMTKLPDRNHAPI